MAGDAIETVNPDDYLGKVLDGRYRIESVLGQGGMGMVFKATQTSMGRPVAVKTLHPQLAMAPTFFERFKREAELASRLHHPNIITIFDFGRTEQGLCYYVMEMLEGESLRQRVKRDGPMSLRQAAAVIEQAALGLGHAHKQQVVHRDLKPHNIMLNLVDGHEYVKVLDFGLVKAMEQEDEEQLTSTGQVLGTPQYMPPEQAGGEAVDQRSDLYSLAGVFYYTLCGTSPYGANTVRKALTAALTKQVPVVSTHRAGAPVPKAIDEFFRKALAREKEDRYQNCEEFIADLNLAIKDVPAAQLDALPSWDGKKPSSDGSGSQSGAGQGTPSSAAGSKRSNVGPIPASERSTASRGAPSKPLGGGGELSAHQRETAPDLPSQVDPPPKRGMPMGVKAAVIAVPLVLVGLAVGLFVSKGEKPNPVPPPEKVAIAAPQKPAQPTTETPKPAEPPKPTEPTAVAPVEPPKPADAPRVTVTIKTSPPSAAVLEDGVLVGKTPLERKWEKGTTHALTFQLAGHVDVERSFRLDADDTFEIALAPTPGKTAPAATGGKKKPKAGSGEEMGAFE